MEQSISDQFIEELDRLDEMGMLTLTACISL